MIKAMGEVLHYHVLRLAAAPGNRHKVYILISCVTAGGEKYFVAEYLLKSDRETPQLLQLISLEGFEIHQSERALVQVSIALLSIYFPQSIHRILHMLRVLFIAPFYLSVLDLARYLGAQRGGSLPVRLLPLRGAHVSWASQTSPVRFEGHVGWRCMAYPQWSFSSLRR